jgi:hypothetical protein
VRLLRGSLLALCCALLALSGHLAGGGRASAALPLLVVAAALGSAFTIWADRQRSLGEIGAAALGSQVVLHTAFALCASGGGPHEAGWDARMVAAHVVAASALAWVLARGEAALWTLDRAVRAIASVRLLPRLPVVDLRSLRAAEHTTLSCLGAGLVLASAHARRGPPRGLAA